MQTLDIDNKLKEKVLIFQRYIRPLIKKENRRVETLRVTKQDDEFYSNLEKEWGIKKNIILEAFMYYSVVEELKEKNSDIITIYEFFVNLDKPDKLKNKKLFLTPENILIIN